MNTRSPCPPKRPDPGKNGQLVHQGLQLPNRKRPGAHPRRPVIRCEMPDGTVVNITGHALTSSWMRGTRRPLGLEHFAIRVDDVDGRDPAP